MNVFDMIGPVMIGPSSSHTAGAARLGKVARSIFAREPVYAHIQLYASFAKTGQGHGTDKALLAGILGASPDDESIRDSFNLAKEKGLSYKFEEVQLDNAHPNTAIITLTDKDGFSFSLQGASIGGGVVQVSMIDGLNVDLNFEMPTILVRHEDTPGLIALVTEELYKDSINICNFQLARQEKGGLAIMTIGLDNKPETYTIDRIRKIPKVFSAYFFDTI